MNNYPDLESVLNVASNKVSPQKLELLKRKLEEALEKSLSSYIVEDPIIIRHLLVKNLRDEGTSPGVIQALEQLFMGIIRRAAINGLLPAPPEGPWTHAWQSMLDTSAQVSGAKSIFRSLASWATAHGIAPADVNEKYLNLWIKDTMMNKEVLLTVEKVFELFSSKIKDNDSYASPQLLERLQKKALRGTVRAYLKS